MRLIAYFNELKANRPTTAIAWVLGLGFVFYLAMQIVQSQLSPEYVILKEVIKKFTIVISIICLITPVNILFYAVAQRIRRK